MMKILIFSDSHGDLSYMCKAVKKEKPDYVFHLGDHDRDAAALQQEFQTLPVAAVCGNCDGWGSETPKVRLVSLSGVRMFLCHGHTYGVKGSLLRASYAAREMQADILFFGHTHEPHHEKDLTGLTLFNPGSCGYGDPTCGVLILDDGGGWRLSVKHIR